MSSISAYFFGVIIGIIVGIIIESESTKDIKRQAVERNHAEWVADTNGNTKWRWKEAQP